MSAFRCSRLNPFSENGQNLTFFPNENQFSSETKIYLNATVMARIDQNNNGNSIAEKVTN